MDINKGRVLRINNTKSILNPNLNADKLANQTDNKRYINVKNFVEYGMFVAFSIMGDEGCIYPAIIYMDEKGAINTAYAEDCEVKMPSGQDLDYLIRLRKEREAINDKESS